MNVRWFSIGGTIAVVAVMTGVTLSAQWLKYPTPGVARTAAYQT